MEIKANFKRIVWRVASCRLAVYVAGTVGARPQSSASLRAGKIIWVRLDRKLDSKTAHVGDVVEAELTKPAKLHKQVVLPAGTRLRGTVEAVRAADRQHKIRPRLSLEFREMTFPDGRPLQADASMEYSERNGYRRRALEYFAGGLGGAFIGNAIGSRWGGTGAGIGGSLGALLGEAAVGYWVNTQSKWHDLKLLDGHSVAMRLDNELRVPAPPPAKP